MNDLDALTAESLTGVAMRPRKPVPAPDPNAGLIVALERLCVQLSAQAARPAPPAVRDAAPKNWHVTVNRGVGDQITDMDISPNTQATARGAASEGWRVTVSRGAGNQITDMDISPKE